MFQWVLIYFLFQTAFLQGVLGRNLRYVATLNKESMSSFTINTVQVYGQEKYILVSMKLKCQISNIEAKCDHAIKSDCIVMKHLFLTLFPLLLNFSDLFGC